MAKNPLWVVLFFISFFIPRVGYQAKTGKKQNKKKQVIYVDNVFYDLLTVNSDL